MWSKADRTDRGAPHITAARTSALLAPRRHHASTSGASLSASAASSVRRRSKSPNESSSRAAAAVPTPDEARRPGTFSVSPVRGAVSYGASNTW